MVPKKLLEFLNRGHNDKKAFREILAEEEEHHDTFTKLLEK